jgi:hypothetical protein
MRCDEIEKKLSEGLNECFHASWAIFYSHFSWSWEKLRVTKYFMMKLENNLAFEFFTGNFFGNFLHIAKWLKIKFSKGIV